MGLFKSMTGMNTVFPPHITNDWISTMPRSTLTPEQQRKSYAKYYLKPMALVPQADLDLVNQGAISPTKALPISRAKELLLDGDLEGDVGYCLMEDGTGFAATKVFMPAVTPEMIDWWFNWHPLDGLRYMIWCPVAHIDIQAKTPDAHRDSSGVPLPLRNREKIHYPVEGFDVKGASPVQIAFQEPEIFGISSDMLAKSKMKTSHIAVVHGVKPAIPICMFFHAVREVEGGIQYRSRYWVNMTVYQGKIQKSKIPLPKSFVCAMARNNCIHSLIEYNHLASILPQLYKEEKGLIL